MRRPELLKLTYQAWLAQRPFLDWIEYPETTLEVDGLPSFSGWIKRVSSS